MWLRAFEPGPRCPAGQANYDLCSNRFARSAVLGVLYATRERTRRSERASPSSGPVLLWDRSSRSTAKRPARRVAELGNRRTWLITAAKPETCRDLRDMKLDLRAPPLGAFSFI